jgi:hypothetical protein
VTRIAERANRDGAVASADLDHVARANADRANDAVRQKGHELLIGSHDARRPSYSDDDTIVRQCSRTGGEMKRSGSRWVRKSVMVDARKLAVVRQARAWRSNGRRGDRLGARSRRLGARA